MQSTKRPHILITNDDSVDAPGIRHLWKALKGIADITVVAPAYEQSAVGMGITIRKPMFIEKHSWDDHFSAWSVSGTPADCVKLALNVVLKEKPDFIFSGINRGSNSGRNVLYSGTVAATMEGVLQGIPSVAFSCHDYFNPNYAAIEPFVPKVLAHLIEHPLPEGTLLNINFPHPPKGEEIRGIKMTRQGKEYWSENPDCRNHPVEGSNYYWMGAAIKEYEEADDSDVVWIKKGYAAAVPVHVGELTDHGHLQAHKDRFEQYFCR